MSNPHPFGQAGMSISVFLSTVSDEFRAYRDELRSDLSGTMSEGGREHALFGLLPMARVIPIA